MSTEQADGPSPSESTDPTPKRRERRVDGLLRAAANTAPKVVGGELGEQLRRTMWTFYFTPSATNVEELAKAILNHPAVASAATQEER